MGNYRPISILSVIAKILEKLIFNQLYSYLSSNSIIDVNQSGFRPQHSTATALLNVTEDWLDSLDKGDIVGMVTIDLKKAFDTVDHAILFDKLKLIGLDKRACEWFLNYLTDRRQYTVVNGVKSDELNVICGIPQGANLGPLLFTIYVNEISNCIKKCSISLYADDTCIYYPGKTTETIENVINADLIRLSKWLNSTNYFSILKNVRSC